MVKITFPLLVAAALFFSCNDTPQTPAQKTDSTPDTASARHGLSVSDPVYHEPHAVKDTCYDCTHIERWDNGVIYIRGEVEGGLRVGEWMTFYKSGKPWSQGTYVKGLRQGYGVAWYENGQKSQEGYYKDDKMVGVWKFWDPYGNMKEKNFGGK